MADIDSMRDKFIQLAQAFDESQNDWRPMAGVRSVQAVLGLAVAEAHMFPTGVGVRPARGSRRRLRAGEGTRIVARQGGALG